MLPTDWIGTTERESDRDGVLSTTTEAHALVLGVAAGVAGREAVLDVALGIVAPVAPAHEEAAAEPWYFAGGYLLGRTIAYVRDR